MDKRDELRLGFETAYIDGSVASNSLYSPQFVSNNYKDGKKVLSSIEDELLRCDKFQISVAFITLGGITPLLQTLKELEKKNIPGEILTTNYLNFSEPKALEKLNGLSNITLKMYDVQEAGEGFHTKGYIFKTDEVYRIIIGSSNITSAALTRNQEWNTKLVSTEQGEMAKEIVAEFNRLWNSQYALDFNEFYENYKEQYKIIKHQRDIARKDQVVSLEKYRLKPNSMQVGFITNLKKILEAGEDKALLISATGTGKTYASAFAMRELGFKRVLFLVHRGQLARQTKKSYEKVFAKSVSMGLVGAGYHEYDADYVFATVQTLNRDEHLLQYDKDAFDCIVLDEAHHVTADTYQKIMKHFSPKLWLGMTATPDKRDNNVAGRNVYELFNYQIAYEIRLQQAMEENLLCPFHYFGITDLSIVGDDKDNRDFSMLTSDERVKHIIQQANYYGYSGEKVKGLIFCSSIKETQELSYKFNNIVNPDTGKYFRTIALNGDADEQERQDAFERLSIYESDVRMAGFRDSKGMFFRLYSKYKERTLAIIRKSFETDDKRLAKMGGYAICEFYIRYNEFETVMHNMEKLSEEQMNAILHMAVIYLEYDEYREISKDIILRCKNSEIDIEFSLGRIFIDNLVDVERDSEFLKTVMKSKVSRRMVYSFVHYLEENAYSLVDYAEVIIALCNGVLNTPKEQLERKWGIESDISKLIIALYDETANSDKEAEQKIAENCLELWDVMFEKQIGQVRELSRNLMNR